MGLRAARDQVVLSVVKSSAPSEGRDELEVEGLVETKVKRVIYFMTDRRNGALK